MNPDYIILAIVNSFDCYKQLTHFSNTLYRETSMQLPPFQTDPESPRLSLFWTAEHYLVPFLPRIDSLHERLYIGILYGWIGSVLQ